MESEELVAAALRKHSGMLALAARTLKVSLSTLYNYFARWPELHKVLEEVREGRLDEAEGQLMAAVRRGEAWAVCFFLKTQGKARGYVERHETKDVTDDAADDAALDAELSVLAARQAVEGNGAPAHPPGPGESANGRGPNGRPVAG